MVGKLRAVNPFHGGAIQRLRFAGQKLAEEKFQMDGFFGVVVADFLEQFADGNFHAQFLADFADEALLETFRPPRVCRREIPTARRGATSRGAG